MHDFEDERHFNGFGIGISLPSWRPRSAIKAAEAEHNAATFDALSELIELKASLQADYARAVSLRRLVKPELFDDAYPQLLRKALDAGRITLFQYLTEYQDFLEARQAQIDAEAEALNAEAVLRRYFINDPDL